MKKLLISTAAIALLFGAASAAPGDDNDNKHKGHDAGAMSGPAHDNGPAMQGPAHDNNNAMRGNTMSGPNANAMGGPNANNNNNDNDHKRGLGGREIDRTVTTKKNETVNRDVNVNRNVTVNRTVNEHRNIDVTKYHRNFTAPKRFHAQSYRAPRGYHYQRWTYGQRLPSIYWTHDYWLTDFLTFGLIAPPDGYVWVRYGDDALLIDEYTGDIIQVEYDVFY